MLCNWPTFVVRYSKLSSVPKNFSGLLQQVYHTPKAFSDVQPTVETTEGSELQVTHFSRTIT